MVWFNNQLAISFSRFLDHPLPTPVTNRAGASHVPIRENFTFTERLWYLKSFQIRKQKSYHWLPQLGSSQSMFQSYNLSLRIQICPKISGISLFSPVVFGWDVKRPSILQEIGSPIWIRVFYSISQGFYRFYHHLTSTSRDRSIYSL